MNRFLLLSITFLLCGTYAFSQGYSGLIGRWSLNGNANDVSGHGLNGTVYGATLTNGASGAANSAYQFNGSTDYILIPYDSSMNLTKFSICAEVKPTGFYSGECQSNAIVWRGIENYSNGSFYLIYYDNGYDADCNAFNPDHEVFNCAAGTGTLAIPDTATYYASPIDSGKWYCVVSTFDADTMKIYVNGTLKLKYYYPNTIGTGTDGITFGMSSDPSSMTSFPYPMTGALDEVRIYNRVLTNSDVQTFCDSVTADIGSANIGDPTGINNISVNQQITISPNPTSGLINIHTPKEWNGTSVIIVNSIGQYVINRTLDANTNSSLDLSSLPAGMYMIRVQYKNNTMVKKIIKN